MAEPVERYIISAHAAIEMERRGLDKSHINAVLASPEERWNVRSGRVVLQSRVQMASTEFLIRVFVGTEQVPPVVVMAYRTSKVSKYWRGMR